MSRPQKQAGTTKSYPLRLSADRRARWERWAEAKGMPLADAIRATIDAACDRARVPRSSDPPLDGADRVVVGAAVADE